MDACDHAVHDFHHDSHDFSHSIGSWLNNHNNHDNSHDTDWGHVVESGLNTGSSWLEMNKACDSHVGADTSNTSNTGW